MIAALDEARNRAVPSARVRVAGACVAAAVLLVLGGVRPTTVVASTTLDEYELTTAVAADGHDRRIEGAHA